MQPASTFPVAIARAVAGEVFTCAETTALFDQIMDGQATPAQLAALLVALRMRGETADELLGAARALRARATPIPGLDALPRPLLDTCGTGGDGAGTLNVSTLAALTAAACGVTVAKHGNRAQSSRSGSADVLEALGVNVQATPEQVLRCLREVRIGFLFAPAFHGATRAAAHVRREIGTRTIFNLLGPLTNPANADRQVVGVFAARWVEPLARALLGLGVRRALVVHGETAAARGGSTFIDELSPDGPTSAALVLDGEVRALTLTPADFGLRPAHPDDASLHGGTIAENAAAARRILAGEADLTQAGPQSVVMTAAAGLWLCDVAPDLPSGAFLAAAALRSGRVAVLLQQLAETSHG